MPQKTTNGQGSGTKIPRRKSAAATPAALARRAERQAELKAERAAAIAENTALASTVALEDEMSTPQADVRQIQQPIVKPTAGSARIRPRHRILLLSFILAVLLPLVLIAGYLWTRAADQYASTVGFSVRSEQVTSAMDLLGGLSGLTKSSSSDTDILYEFLKSQKLVADIHEKLDLRKIWSKPSQDFYFRFKLVGSIEDLVDYWGRMVRTSYDGNTGLIEVRVLAFDPTDATTIAQTLFEQSSEMINNLSAIAREDAIKYAREELNTTKDRLKSSREAITKFRTLHEMVDPSSDVAAQVGLLGSLQNQLAAAQIELDLFGDMQQKDDPRLIQGKRRIEVIKARIAAERNKVGISSQEGTANLVGDYERLAVDREFAERAYVAALASYDAAEAEARRKSRYLAAHIIPTTAEVSRYPERLTLLSVTAIFLLLAWAISCLVIYSLKDRR